MKTYLLAAALVVASAAVIPAQTSPEAPTALRVVVKPAMPFAFEEDGEIKGFSVDLWEKVAAEAGLKFETKVVQTVPELLEAVKSGAADVGIGAISITPEREKVLDFSHPFFKSGLQVMARSKGETGAFTAFRALLSKNVAVVCLVLLVAVLLVSHILWVVERTFGWFNFDRVLAKDYEHTTASAEGWVKLAGIYQMVQRCA